MEIEGRMTRLPLNRLACEFEKLLLETTRAHQVLARLHLNVSPERRALEQHQAVPPERPTKTKNNNQNTEQYEGWFQCS